MPIDVRGTTVALNAIRDEIHARRAELATLERTEGILERALERGTRDECDACSAGAPCHGRVYARFCRHCGHVTRRCDAHGGLRAATPAHKQHIELEHPGGAEHPAPANAG